MAVDGATPAPRRLWLLPSVPDLIFSLVAPILAFGAAVRLTQSDGDLAAHIRLGEAILAGRGIPATSLVSYTVAGQQMPDPAWLSEVVFALLFRAGGLALVACATACLAAGVHALAAGFLRARGVDARWALLAALMSLALGATHWLARPHMFSIAAVMLLVVLLESGTLRSALLVVPLFALWANLHGGWIYGLALLGLYVAGDAAEYALSIGERPRQRLTLHAAILLLAAGAVLINPYGPALYGQIAGTLFGAAPAGMDEFRPPDFRQPEDAVFLVAILACVTLLALQRRRMPAPVLSVLVGTLVAALISGRNIALFGVSGWLLLALHSSRSVVVPRSVARVFEDFARAERRSRVGVYALPVAVGILLLGFFHGRVANRQLIADGFDESVFPVRAVASARAAHLPGHTLLPWTWSGYASLSWSGQPLHVDPLRFSDETLRSYLRMMEVRPGWRQELDRWAVSLAVLPPRAPLASALQALGWQVRYRDRTAVVLMRDR